MPARQDRRPPRELVDLVGQRVAARLVDAYAEPPRHYHTLDHATRVARQAAALGASRPCLLAAWFHDAVYDPTSPGNEAASARLLGRLLDGDPDAEHASRLVRTTADHRPPPGDDQAAILCDADLAVLADPPERYEAYRAAVRREYAHVPDDAWAAGRGAVLADLLAREHLFHTPQARRSLEQRARRNLRRELEQLRDGQQRSD